MKYIAIPFMAALVFFAACKSTTTYRATDTPVVVVSPSAAEAAFILQYPNAQNVVWTPYVVTTVTPIDWQLVDWMTPLDANARLVHFNQDNQNYYVLYDRNGMRVASANVLTDFSVIPSAVNDVLLLRYPAYHVTALSRVTMTNGMAYEVELKKMFYTARVLVDDNGNVIDSRLIVNDHL
jgi:hypothetical protein